MALKALCRLPTKYLVCLMKVTFDKEHNKYVHISFIFTFALWLHLLAMLHVYNIVNSIHF